jgi:hypothetical protein
MSFSVFLNSYSGNGNPSSTTYQINWDNINTNGWTGKYKVWFSFLSTGAGITSTPACPYITTNFGATQNSYSVATSNGTSNNNVLGVIKPTSIGSNATYSAIYYENPPVVIQGKPTNNQFTVNLLNKNGTAFTTLDSIHYYMTIYFEKYDELSDTD